tara:strand:- start:1592 stop:2020 length:429 start_codon:yes stop_codon:yes gene_type:complete
MKRFGRYDNDFNALFECYNLVNPDVVVERELPSVSRQKNTTSSGESFPGLKKIKIFVQKPGRGADLMHMIDLKTIDSDDSDGGTVISGKESDKNFHMITTKKSAQIKTVDDQGQLENDFVTNIAPKFDRTSGELTIIHVEHL